MKNKDIVQLYNNLKELGNLEGVKFAYFVVKNMKILQSEIAVFEDIIKPSEKYVEYEQKRLDICKKYAEKDENGNCKIENDKFVGCENNEEFNKEIQQLNNEYAEVILKRNQQLKEIEQILEEENNNIKLMKIKVEDIPKNITVKQMMVINDLIDENSADW